MTLVSNYIKEHSGEEWFRILRIPFMFFAVFELLLLAAMTLNVDSKLHYLLDGKAVFDTWYYTILLGSFGALFGLAFRSVKRLCKYHVTSTAQLVNALAWGCAGFILLDSTDEAMLALSLFLMSVINVALAIIDEGWGDRRINSAKEQGVT